MKTIRLTAIGMGLMLIASLGLISHNSYGNQGATRHIQADVDINITINEGTTDDELNEITAMLEENGLSCNFSDITRNESNLITGISIELTNNHGQSLNSTIENNMGIGEFTFGRKDGMIYIDQNGNENFAFFNMPNVQAFGFANDSLFKDKFHNFSFNFDDFFNENDAWAGNSEPANIDELMERIHKRFSSFDSKTNQKRFNFVDDPNTDKLIIIDGKESDFETLNMLSLDDRIEAVDYLKSETAVSIYGDRARDGAVIVTTKD